jgi:hypothetical protein
MVVHQMSRLVVKLLTMIIWNCFTWQAVKFALGKNILALCLLLVKCMYYSEHMLLVVHGMSSLVETSNFDVFQQSLAFLF